MSVVVVDHVTLDGVMQAPGRADEDIRDGFEHGGWALSIQDPALPHIMGAVMGEGSSWLCDDLPGNLVIMGSGEPIRTLLPFGLIEEMLLLVDPVTVGGGHPLLPADGALRRFELVSADTVAGLVVARYRVLG